MDGMEDVIFLCNKEHYLDNILMKRRDQLDELAIRIVENRCHKLMKMVEKYWIIYLGTFEAI